MTQARVPDFSALRVAVVGDLVADHYLYAQPRRLSREAPVIVLRHVRETTGAGGAANVARNLRALGAQVRVLGAVGRDAAGRELVHVLGADGIDTDPVESVAGWTTPTKTRVLAAEPRRSLQQVLRIDHEPETALAEAVRARLATQVRALAGEIDALVVSDYEYGAAHGAVAAAAVELARMGTIVVLDPRANLAEFAGVTALTPNVEELARFTHTPPERLDDARALRTAAHALVEQARCRWLLVTRGNLGMALFGEGIPAHGLAVEASGQGEITDVCGAGDTAAAVFALALAARIDAPRAMELANAASGVVVMENGAAVCRPAQLQSALQHAPAPVQFARADVT